MNIQVLIPTMNKSKDDIIALYHAARLSTDALIANQCGKNETYEIKIDNHCINVVCSDSIGVSKNRNVLLKNCSGDICICIDDDCSLVENYEQIISNSFDKNHTECISFNGFYVKHNDRKVHNKKSSLVKRFNQISYAGAPGFAFRKNTLGKISFRENIGVPNCICAGEDTMFYSDIVKNKISLYRDSTLIFSINNDDLDSSYFTGIDEKYVLTRGYITYLLHPFLYRIYMFRHIFRFRKQNKNVSLTKLKKWFLKGSKLAENEAKNI